MTPKESFEELAQVIRSVIDEAINTKDKEENNLIDKTKRCAFCGTPDKLDVVIPRGRHNLLVCLDCYTAAKAIMETNRKWL